MITVVREYFHGNRNIRNVRTCFENTGNIGNMSNIKKKIKLVISDSKQRFI